MNDIVNIDNPAEGLPVQWQTSLVLDVAMGVDPEIICDAYGLQYTQLRATMELPSFQARLEATRKELEKEGASFKLKAQMQAEEYLKTSFALAQDQNVDPKVRLNVIESTVRWAGFDKPAGQADAGSGNGISIHINLGNAEKQVEGRTFESDQ